MHNSEPGTESHTQNFQFGDAACVAGLVNGTQDYARLCLLDAIELKIPPCDLRRLFAQMIRGGSHIGTIPNDVSASMGEEDDSLTKIQERIDLLLHPENDQS